MRYYRDEDAILIGVFGVTGLDVRMKMLVLENDSLLELTSDMCLESQHLQGVYLFSTANIIKSSIVGNVNILCEMVNQSDTTMKRYGKISFRDLPNNIVELTEIKTMLTDVQYTLDTVAAEVL